METVGISHVSDTALWIAAYRAAESERPDAVFHDPLARKLAGERGAAIASSLQASEAMAFAMVVRTTAIDRLVEEAIARGVDTVINLGAGLDTRPYRMKLPSTLKWVEVDFPDLIHYKDQQLADEQAVCQLTRLPADLTKDEGRTSLLRQLTAETSNCLVITEGVIGYLTREAATQLSRDLWALPSITFWIQDYERGSFRQWGRQKVKRMLKNAPLQFNESDPLEFFAQHGWKVCQDLAILDEADRIGRSLPAMFPWSLLMKVMPGTIRSLGNKTYGYVMFSR